MVPTYASMGIGEGRTSPPVRGDKMKAAVPHMRLASDQSLAKLQIPGPPTTNGLMMEVWASVASWFFRPDSSAPPHVQCTAGATSTTVCSANSDKSAANHFALAPTICTAIRCTVPSCSCECFTPGKMNIRYCDTCNHSWVPHALDKLGFRHLFGQSPVEPVQPNVAFDIASLVLYGCQALPIRLKILLDRLFSVLQREEVLQVLHGFGWTHDDYARGYILQQEPHGGVLDRWNICSPEEEPLVLQQFLRFGETRAITQQLLLAQQELIATSSANQISGAQLHQLRIDSDIKKFIERNSRSGKGEPEDRKTLPYPAMQHLPHRTHKRSTSPSRRPSPPTTTMSSLHPHPIHMSLHHPLPQSASLPKPPPPPPMSPHQKHPPSTNFLKLPPNLPTTNGPCTTSSPPSSISSSPLSISPLNRLQSMQPFDFRKMGGFASMPVGRGSPEQPSGKRRISEQSDTSPPGLMNLSLTSPTMCLPPPPPPPATSSLPVSFSSVNTMVTSSIGIKSEGMDFMSGGGSSDFGSDDDTGDEENSHSALNLSRDGVAIKQRKRSQSHSRSLSTPMKRQWGSSTELPLNLGIQLINPATGKKRVQCNVCLKTFCDKGALKIHFSAVHLREMHKCSVEGCNMMFSSRRSRNRHSANPNPKLHSPHLRRKISPHDGRSSQSHPLIIPPPSALSLAAAGINPLSFGPFPLLTPPPEMRQHAHHFKDSKQSLDLSMHRYDERRLDMSNNNTTSSDDAMMRHMDQMDDDDDDDDDDDGIVVDGGADDYREGGYEPIRNGMGKEYGEMDEDDVSEVKRVKMSNSDLDDDVMSNMGSNEDSLSVLDTHSVKEENGVDMSTFSSKRKRKNQNPTRCAIPAVGHNEILSDEDSNDVVFTPVAPHQEEKVSVVEKVLPVAKEMKKEEEVAKLEVESDNLDKTEQPGQAQKEQNEEVKEVGTVKIEKDDEMKEHSEIKTSLSPVPPTDDDDVKKEQVIDEPDEKDDEEDDEESKRPASSSDSHNSDESLNSSNALRQLESLSHGHFGDLLRGGRQQSQSPHLPQQFPGMGFMMGGPPSPSHSQGSSENSNPDSPSDDNSLMYFTENGTLVGNMDVPVDKDNPRRCAACGKIFQNHFGVKTHFQNVHLKLMHKCTVDGCNAAFPSKRSRDRHSANLNLHRKLLSTSSSDQAGGGLFMDKSPFASLSGNPALHSEFLARLYAESQNLPLSIEAFKNLPHSHPHLGLPPPPGSLAEQMLLNGDRLPPTHPSLLLPPLGGLGFPNLNNFSHHLSAITALNGSRKDQPSGTTSPTSPKSLGPTTPPVTNTGLVYSVEDDLPTADVDGHYPCLFCSKITPDTSALKEHYEASHLADMFRCKVAGCDKVFSTRSTRNQHSDDEAVHGVTSRTPLSNDTCS